jgi:hypothetical protein
MKKLFATSLLTALLFASTAFAFEQPSLFSHGTGAGISQLAPDRGHTRQGDN